MESIWQTTQEMPQFPRLEGDRQTDVLVVGGGFAGLLTTYLLKRQGVDCLLLEKDRLCAGVSGKTTAKITYQHGLIYHKLLKDAPPDTAARYLKANRQALEEYAKLCQNIDCGFETTENYVFSLRSRKKLEEEAEALRTLGCDVSFTEQPPLPLETKGAVGVKNQAQFHPLRFAAAIAKDLPVFEHSQVQNIKGHTAQTDRGTVQAQKIIVATHFPFIDRRGLYFLKLYQHRSYVLSLENAEAPPGMYVDEDKAGLSFRSYGDTLLLGGGGHRTGKPGGWDALRQVAAKAYPDARETAHWATQDCMTLDARPYIGRYAKHKRELFVATGFNKWGMTGSMAAALMLRDMVLGKENEFAGLFDPARSILHPQLAANLLESTVNLLSFSKKRCPHLGCALRWNRAERTWDCPCHGSRFKEDGKVLDNPANRGLKHP